MPQTARKGDSEFKRRDTSIQSISSLKQIVFLAWANARQPFILFFLENPQLNPVRIEMQTTAKKNPFDTNTNLDLGSDLCLDVGHLDAQLLRSRDDVDSLSGGDVVGDLSSVCAVVHQQELNIVDVADKESLVAGGGHVTGLLVRAEADRRQDLLAPEPPPHAGVNTLGLSPASTNAHKPVTLVTAEVLGALLDDRNVLLGGNHLEREINVNELFFWSSDVL